MGLIFLRIAVGYNAIANGLILLANPEASRILVWTVGPSSIIVGIALLIGFLTPFAAGVATIGYLILSLSRFFAEAASKEGEASTAIYLAVIALALVLLGPGSASVDAQLFGRREIIIP